MQAADAVRELALELGDEVVDVRAHVFLAVENDVPDLARGRVDEQQKVPSTVPAVSRHGSAEVHEDALARLVARFEEGLVMFSPRSLSLSTVVAVDDVRAGILGGVVAVFVEDLVNGVGVGVARSCMPQFLVAGRGSDRDRWRGVALKAGVEPVKAVGVARGDSQALLRRFF